MTASTVQGRIREDQPIAVDGLGWSPTSMNIERALAAACGLVGLDASGARLLRHFANAVYLLPGEEVVVRIGYDPAVVDRAATAIRVAGWLSDRGFPATAPADLPRGATQPVVVRAGDIDIAATFWRYYPQPVVATRPSPHALGRLVRRLHQMPPPPEALTEFRPLRSLLAALEGPNAGQAVPHADRAWLLARIRELRGAYARLDFPLGRGLIHGDIYAGNLLWDLAAGPHAVVLGDWDAVGVGPRELDLIPPHIGTRFGGDPVTALTFGTAYGYDITGWAGFPVLSEIRELSTLTALVRLAPTSPASARELAHRLHTLKTNDNEAVWCPQ
jgi:hypothetical protein